MQVASVLESEIKEIEFVCSQFSLVELGKRLLASSRDGDTAEVKALINKGAPFTTDWLGTSPLHLGSLSSMLHVGYMYSVS